MLNFSQKTRIGFLKLILTVILYTTPFSSFTYAASTLISEPIVQRKIKELEQENSDLTKRCEVREKLYEQKGCYNEREVDCATLRTYKRIIKLNKEKLKVWRAFIELKQ